MCSASNEVNFVTLADNFIVQFSNLLKLPSGMENKSAYPGPVITGSFEKRAPAVTKLGELLRIPLPQIQNNFCNRVAFPNKHQILSICFYETFCGNSVNNFDCRAFSLFETVTGSRNKTLAILWYAQAWRIRPLQIHTNF